MPATFKNGNRCCCCICGSAAEWWWKYVVVVDLSAVAAVAHITRWPVF